ncbi:hypothetical protein IAE22_28420, partial [Bacillus sp. S34]|nr:hypothetical protein [Bacillus sp. S34]
MQSATASTENQVPNSLLNDVPLAAKQGDTSTTMNQPLDELGAICDRHGVLFYSDGTATIDGIDVIADPQATRRSIGVS